MKKIAYVGIDYHLNSLSLAVLVEGETEFHDLIRINNQDKFIIKYMNKLSKQFEIKACYEASFSGYSFLRKMSSWGYHCDVIAPSLIPKKKGDRRKNDKRDAKDLARLYASGLLTPVHVPTEFEESVRSLIRCRLSFKEFEKRTKNQINSLLLAQGVKCPFKKRWTRKYMTWLSKLELPERCLKTIFEELLGLMTYIQGRIASLDNQIEEIAQSDIYAPSVKKLRAFKGIGTLIAMILIAEITDFRRFPNARSLMAYLGLIPSEETSGDKIRSGSITKTGNSRVRKHIIEAVQHYPKHPKVSQLMKKELGKVDAQSANIAIDCLNRLHKRYWHLTLRGKTRAKALTAIAREFAGFIWAMMQPEPITI
jgi:transposase